MTHTLDPDDWQAFRARARDMLETVLDEMESYREGPVWRHPDELELPQISGEDGCTADTTRK